MLVLDVVIIFCLFMLQRELHECIRDRDWTGVVILSVVFLMTMTGTVLLNVSYYGH